MCGDGKPCLSRLGRSCLLGRSRPVEDPRLSLKRSQDWGPGQFLITRRRAVHDPIGRVLVGCGEARVGLHPGRRAVHKMCGRQVSSLPRPTGCRARWSSSSRLHEWVSSTEVSYVSGHSQPRQSLRHMTEHPVTLPPCQPQAIHHPNQKGGVPQQLRRRHPQVRQGWLPQSCGHGIAPSFVDTRIRDRTPRPCCVVAEAVTLTSVPRDHACM